MRKILNIFNCHSWSFLCLLAVSLILTSACKDDEEAVLKPGEGKVVFQISRKNLYSISSLSEIVAVKPVLLCGEETIELPSLSLEGDDDVIQSVPYTLKAGMYMVKSYKAADKDGNWIADLILEDENTFEVKEGSEPAYFNVPAGIRVTLSSVFLKNTLLGICNEIWPNNKAAWPWKEEDDFEDWTNMEWEVDDDGNLSYIAGFYMDKTFYDMETLPEPICNLPMLNGITVIGDSIDQTTGEKLKNKLKYLPKKLIKTNIKTLTFINCEIEEFPEFLTECKLNELSFINCNIKSIPESISKMEDLYVLSLKGNQITSVPASIGKMKNLSSLDLSDNPIESLPDGVFDGCTALQCIVLSNTNISSLPSLPAISEPAYDLGDIIGRGLFLEGCKFTSIPASALECPAVRTLYMKDNQITSVNLTEEQMKNIDQLFLDGNKITSLNISSPKLMCLSLSNCGLTVMPENVKADALHIMNLKDNKITAVPDNYFAKYPVLTQADLGGNQLTSLPAETGFNTEALNYLGLTNLPQLTWTIPSTWQNVILHTDNGNIGETVNYPIHYINIYSAGSPKVNK